MLVRSGQMKKNKNKIVFLFLINKMFLNILTELKFINYYMQLLMIMMINMKTERRNISAIPKFTSCSVKQFKWFMPPCLYQLLYLKLFPFIACLTHLHFLSRNRLHTFFPDTDSLHIDE